MEIPRGEITKTVYTLIKQEKFVEAVEILEQLLDLQPNSRSAISLLGYCSFQLQNFENSSIYYDRLSSLYPEVPEYQYYLAQSLYNLNNYEEALNASYLRGDPDPALEEKVTKLQAAIQYCRNEPADAKALVEKCNEFDPDTEVSKGCLAYKEGNYSEASTHFENASKSVGMEPLLWYNRAVTCYQKGNLPDAAHFVGEILEHGALNFAELQMGQNDKTGDLSVSMQSVGNSRLLHKSALIETLNLKAVVEYDLKKVKAARQTLKDLPPRLDEELDPVTLHNLAILNVDLDPMESLKKLRFLLEQENEAFPPETFVNLLILYWRYEHFDLMADLMAVYEEYKMKYVHPDMRRFFESLIKKEVAPNEATKEIEEQCKELGKCLHELVKKVLEIKGVGNEDEIRTVCNDFDDLVDGTYMPMLLTLGKIFWDKDELNKVEDILKLGAAFLDDRDPWLINCAHVMYRRGKDYNAAAGLYELVVRKHQQQLLQVSASSLANLVVCYVHIGRNEEAEKMITKIEEQEVFLLMSHKDKGIKVFHSCIMSLVIGTLYCVKSNYTFGINRMLQALRDIKTKLGPDTWFYVKSCILSLISRLVKINVTVSQETVRETMFLLLKCEEYGRDVTTVIEETSANPQMEEDYVIPSNFGTKTVAYEARYLQCLLNQVQELGFMQ